MNVFLFFLLQAIDKGDSVDVKYTGCLLENGAIGKVKDAIVM